MTEQTRRKQQPLLRIQTNQRQQIERILLNTVQYKKTKQEHRRHGTHSPFVFVSFRLQTARKGMILKRKKKVSSVHPIKLGLTFMTSNWILQLGGRFFVSDSPLRLVFIGIECPKLFHTLCFVSNYGSVRIP